MKAPIFWTVSCLLAMPSLSFCYGEDAHIDVNRAALIRSSAMIGGINLDRVLRDTGWAMGGTATQVFGRSIAWLVSENGGPGEDVPVWRVLNHFLDPTRGVQNGGLLRGEFSSAPYWATNNDAALWWNHAPVQSPPLVGGAFGGDYSWQAALRNYFIGLTGYDFVWNGLSYVTARIAPQAADREAYLANAFRSLGQVMHLVADMSVPAHVRNDVHPSFRYLALPAGQFLGPFRLPAVNFLSPDGYEAWAESNPGAFRSAAEARVGHPDFPVVTPEALTWHNPSADVVEFFTNAASYQDLATHPAREGGLAVFTNLNFVSQDTIFSTPFFYPNRISGHLARLSPGSPYWSSQITNGETIRHFVRDNFLGVALRRLGVNAPLSDTLQIDNDCYRDHAQALAPQAVRYAAGILQRFFGYELVLSPSPLLGESKIDFRIIRSGTRTAQDALGIPAGNAAGSLYVIGVLASGEAELIGGGHTGEMNEPNGTLQWWGTGCYEELRVAFVGWVDGRDYVIGATVGAELRLVPQPGQSLQSGFNAMFAKPTSVYCPTLRPANLSAAGTLTVSAVLEDGTEMDLGSSNWPHWAGGGLRSFKRYKVTFDGSLLTPTPVHLERYHDEIVEDTFVVQQVSASRSGSYDASGGTWTWWTATHDTGLGDQWEIGGAEFTIPNAALRVRFDESIQNGVLSGRYEEVDDGTAVPNISCRERWISAHLADRMRGDPILQFQSHPISANSIVEIDVSTDPAQAADPIRLTFLAGFYHEPSGTYVPASFSFDAHGGRRFFRLGIECPDLFAAGQTYGLANRQNFGLMFSGCKTETEEFPPGSGIEVPMRHERDVFVRSFKLFP